jgi:hypothetical protein
MLSNKVVLALLAAACVAAAGGGAYVAVRQNGGPAQAAGTPATGQVSVAPQPVLETEAAVGSIKPAPEPSASGGAVRRQRSAEAGIQTPGPRAAAAPRDRSTTKPPPPAARTEPAPALERSWPSSTQPQPVESPSVQQIPATTELPGPVELPRAPEPPARSFEELVVSADSVIGLRLDSTISSERAEVEDRVEARIVRDVRVGGAMAIPAGARAIGDVTLVERGGRFKERARLGIRFHTLVLADGSQIPITTETITRFGDSPGNSSAAKIGGGAVAGAILGAIIGGAKGAAIGAASGAGGGTAVVVAGDRSAATFPAGTEVTARILAPVTVAVEK